MAKTVINAGVISEKQSEFYMVGWLKNVENYKKKSLLQAVLMRSD